MPGDTIAGLIVAAGLSSRMKAFKPLLPLNGKSLIEGTVDTLRPWVRDIYVVVGYRQEDVRRALQPSSASASSFRNIHFIYNEQFADADMFESVRLGVKSLTADSGGFFLLPGDMPLVAGHTFRSLLEAKQSAPAAVVQPFYRGKPGHPPLIGASCRARICAYDGEGGLRGALTSFQDQTLRLDVPDPAILMDADLPEDYACLTRYAESRAIPSPEVCEELWAWFQTPKFITAHCRLVAETAQEWTRKLMRAGYPLDLNLVTAGALLHDVAKGANRRNHDTLGASWLEDMGYSSAAKIVGAHTDLPEDALDPLDERAVVYLADKQVQRTTRVTVDQRFQTVLDRFADDPEALTAINRRKKATLNILEKICLILGRVKYDGDH
jgi:putative nucleotidyltransferase with HDIG domain